jgi:hypothetical protein
MDINNDDYLIEFDDTLTELGASAKRKAKHKVRRKKILKGVGAVATGGVSLAISTRKKKIKPVAKKKKIKPVAKKPTVKVRAVARPVAAPRTSLAMRATAPTLSKQVNTFVSRVEKLSTPKKRIVSLAKKVDKAASIKLKKTKKKPVSKRSKVKLQIFSKLKDLTKKLPVTSPTRVRANKRILFECRQMGPYA